MQFTEIIFTRRPSGSTVAVDGNLTKPLTEVLKEHYNEGWALWAYVGNESIILFKA